MTTAELCAWHAIHAGWTYKVWNTGEGWRRNCLCRPDCCDYVYHPSHPFPLTIDGAASAMPPDVTWIRFNGEWRAFDKLVEYAVIDTGDEIHDRYELAKKVIEEDEE